MGKRNIETLDESKDLKDNESQITDDKIKKDNNDDNNNKKVKSVESLDYSKIETPIGKLTIYANGFSIIKITVEGSAVEAKKANNNYNYMENNQNKIIMQFKNEINQFFNGEIKQFKTPYTLEYGSEFQKTVWKELCNIPYGETVSYTDIALKIGKGKKYARAVASACRYNNHLLIIPCHRVVNTQGCVVGYGGKKGIDKQFIISKVERKFK